MVARKTPAAKPAAKPTTGSAGRTMSNAALVRQVAALTARVEALEGIVNSAKLRQQQAVAAKLAQNPEKVAALRELLDLAENAVPGP